MPKRGIMCHEKSLQNEMYFIFLSCGPKGSLRVFYFYDKTVIKKSLGKTRYISLSHPGPQHIEENQVIRSSREQLRDRSLQEEPGVCFMEGFCLLGCFL